MTSKCPRCEKPVFFAEKVSSLGKNWHRFCLKCQRCNRTLSAGGHAEHDGMPYCHKPCYATLFGPKGVNIGGAGSYIYDTLSPTPVNTSMESPSDGSPTTPWTTAQIIRQPSKAKSELLVFNIGQQLSFFFFVCFWCAAEKVMSLGRNWHRPCLRCERCKKTLTSGGHAEHEGKPYCHVPCYGYLFGPKGVNIGEVGCYVYDKDTEQNGVSSQS
uniref:Cysteine rich protein 3 n=1 Tax=Paramormyrops kingsleyae TaxID=1676925 RepID=A0A3B3QFX8_9TELE